MIIGIDPSQRHIGLCFLTEAGPVFDQWNPAGDLLSCFREVSHRMSVLLNGGLPFRNDSPPLKMGDVLFGIEKQLSVGGQSSGTMLVMQTAVYNALESWTQLRRTVESQYEGPFQPQLVSPLPVQLLSYVRKVHGGPKGSSASALVGHFKDTTNYRGRISIHCVDAYYLALFARDVQAGKWKYPLPSKEAPLHPWKILNGHDDSGQNQGAPQENGEALQG